MPRLYANTELFFVRSLSSHEFGIRGGWVSPLRLPLPYHGRLHLITDAPHSRRYIVLLVPSFLLEFLHSMCVSLCFLKPKKKNTLCSFLEFPAQTDCYGLGMMCPPFQSKSSGFKSLVPSWWCYLWEILKTLGDEASLRKQIARSVSLKAVYVLGTSLLAMSSVTSVSCSHCHVSP